MKNFSIQKKSMLGLILMGVSTVTAAVLPLNKKFDKNKIIVGSITNCIAYSVLGSISCKPTIGVVSAPCDVTIRSGTTGEDEGSITDATTVNDL